MKVQQPVQPWYWISKLNGTLPIFSLIKVNGTFNEKSLTITWSPLKFSVAGLAM